MVDDLIWCVAEDVDDRIGRVEDMGFGREVCGINGPSAIASLTPRFWGLPTVNGYERSVHDGSDRGAMKEQNLLCQSV